MSLDLDQVRTFVTSLDLPAPRFGATGISLAPPIDFDAARDQAMVVGSEVVSFVQGITAEQRSDIVNSALLAQLREEDRADRNFEPPSGPGGPNRSTPAASAASTMGGCFEFTAGGLAPAAPAPQASARVSTAAAPCARGT
jgi:hypothetical protein